jgi:hypothetical protein
MQKKFHRTWDYLQANKEMLVSREKGRLKGPNWYAFGYPKSMHLFEKPKIIVPDYNNVPSFTYDGEGHFYKTGYGILPREDRLDSLYLLGLLNSRLLFWQLRRIGTFLRGGYVRFWTKFIEQLPIRGIDFSARTEKASYDRLVNLVASMLSLHRQLAAVKSEAQKEIIARQISATDAEIDRLVYELYDLTEDEIRIVEESQGKR